MTRHECCGTLIEEALWNEQPLCSIGEPLVKVGRHVKVNLSYLTDPRNRQSKVIGPHGVVRDQTGGGRFRHELSFVEQAFDVDRVQHRSSSSKRDSHLSPVNLLLLDDVRHRQLVTHEHVSPMTKTHSD